MKSGQPSRTAWAAALHRAVHQVSEEGRLFRDPLAWRILGVEPEDLVREAADRPERRPMRIFIACRTRFAEDSLAATIDCGVRQLVCLGAGLDTFAYRNPYGDQLRVFEVDHPSTQEWKRQRLQQAGIPIPNTLTFAPVDFERTNLLDGLIASGFDPATKTFCTWLGVVPYLTEEAIFSTLATIASFPAGSSVVFDYGNPPHTFSEEQRAAHEQRASRVAELGEAWVTYFDSAALQARLRSLGFAEVNDLGPREIAQRYFPSRASMAPASGGHILMATT